MISASKAKLKLLLFIAIKKLEILLLIFRKSKGFVICKRYEKRKV